MQDPVGQQREHGGRHQGGVDIPGQMPDEHEHADARQDDSGEEQDVVDEDRIARAPTAMAARAVPSSSVASE